MGFGTDRIDTDSGEMMGIDERGDDEDAEGRLRMEDER